MIDPDLIAKAVNEQIANSVNESVIAALADPNWLEKVERQLVMYCQNRILGKFNNIDTVPELQAAVKSAVTEMFLDGSIPGIDKFVDQTAVRAVVDRSISEQIGPAVSKLVTEPSWVDKIQNLAVQAMTQRVIADLNSIDVASLIKEYVEKHSPSLSALIDRKGINDTAGQLELTVMDGYVVAENDLASKNLQVVEKIITKDLQIDGNLAVRGSINTDNRAWNELSEEISRRTISLVNDQFRDHVTDSVVSKIKNDGISLNDVLIDGVPLLVDRQLSRSIKTSSLEKVGKLEDLSVKGTADLHDTLHVLNRRVGINTASPESALTIWDEEICVTVGKRSKDTAFLGTSKSQNLEIGVNRKASITIDKDGTTAIDKLKIGHNSISFESQTPGYAGQKGDIVFNSALKPGDAFAWICLGQYRWQEIYSK